MQNLYSNDSAVRENATPAKASEPQSSSVATRRFRYSYLCRLIDDNELRDFSPDLRSQLRRAHKQAYWKNLSLLRRDAARILKVRRQQMGAQQEWDFNSLVTDYARVQYLIGTLTLAGITHATRVSVGLEYARAACTEIELLFTTSSPLLGAAA